MTFSKQFIEIMDAIGDKVGIAIDWTAGNVTPYLQDLIERFVKYETYTSVLWLVIGLIVAIIFLICAYKETRQEYADSMIVSICFAIAIFGFIMSIFQILDIIEVNTIPEKTIIEYIKYIDQ